MTRMIMDEKWMRLALDQARNALEAGEFPVGCVLVWRERVVACGARTRTIRGAVNELDHAEMAALARLDDMEFFGDRREISLYCTLEPCLMCYAAILMSGLGRIVYAYEDVMGGGTACDLSTLPPLYRERRVPIIPHVLRRESIRLFQSFFSNPDRLYWRDSLLSRHTLAQTD